MKYRTGEKFTQNQSASIFEIVGRYPKSSGVRLDTLSHDFYKFSIDGIDVYLSEPSIEKLLKRYSGELDRVEAFELKTEKTEPVLPTPESVVETLSAKPKKTKKAPKT